MEYSEFLEHAKTFKRVPVFQQVDAGQVLPINVFQQIKSAHSDAVLLESLDDEAGHYSFIAFESMANFRSKGNRCALTLGDETDNQETQPLPALRQMIKDMSCAPCKQSDFTGSIIGFMSYDAVRLFEHIPEKRPATNLPDLSFDFYRNSLCFDHQNRTLIISHIVDVSNHIEQEYLDAQEILAKLIDSINTSLPSSYETISLQGDTGEFCSDMDDDVFKKMVIKAKEYIRSGDVFQVVLSRSFKEKYTVDPFKIYNTLRKKSPTPYLFYLPIDDAIIMGASPEKLVSVLQGEVSVNPIAGTRKRIDKKYDDAVSQELLSDEKELAEHMMLVDLARNDVGKVSKPGSVQVTELLKIKHFSHVTHITSTVKGQLRDTLDALDALAATFPAGTLSGAPKIRAMEIIDELEATGRGLYGGTICRMDYLGNLDSCIAFRMAVLRDGVATVRAGAGIVFDSNPQTEADETRHKALSMLSAIRCAEADKS